MRVRARRSELEDVQDARRDAGLLRALPAARGGRRRRLPTVHVARRRRRERSHRLRPERPLGRRGRLHRRGLGADAARARRLRRDRRPLGAAPVLRRDGRDGRAAHARGARGGARRDRLCGRIRGGARVGPDGACPTPPGRVDRGRGRRARAPRPRLRAGVGDRHGADRDSRARVRGARLRQGDPRRAGPLRGLGEAGQRGGAPRPGRDRRGARRRRVARGRLVRGHLPSRYPLVALVILDGWGCAPPGRGNAVELADTPVFDELWRTYPHETIEASGEAAGLPPGQMGNSEVGHLTIGAGRRLYQDLMRVNKAIEDGSFFTNPVLVSAFERGRNVHLLGLASHGGVHSHVDHLRALLRFAPEKTWIHAFTDGRDVSPTSAVHDLAELPTERIATVCGRYYAMDRDARWERTQRASDAIVKGEGEHADDPVEALRRSYERGITDEFVEPIVLDGAPRLAPGDTAIFFNFRPDRARQLTQRLLEAGFDVTTMARYRDDLDTPVVFEERNVPETLAQVLAEHGVRQLHVAETEKYAHVTYFFNGGREQEWRGEARILVPSPRDVPSYDHKPEMSAQEVSRRFCDEIGYGFGVVNFANP